MSPSRIRFCRTQNVKSDSKPSVKSYMVGLIFNFLPSGNDRENARKRIAKGTSLPLSVFFVFIWWIFHSSWIIWSILMAVSFLFFFFVGEKFRRKGRGLFARSVVPVWRDYAGVSLHFLGPARKLRVRLSVCVCLSFFCGSLVVPNFTNRVLGNISLCSEIDAQCFFYVFWSCSRLSLSIT